ncbi:hypothetical protein SM124_14235 [Bacillus sp. 31A1R]|uniref:Uncharacterized protein n=1 Tax=Robertmurraya mangrovi TaxID=3098077 RepID=A0ABU5J0E7_9BACI|nr:hypothetical protein [Bacillus sp. 31A1R]MDZ5472888.1 hypothetical protein [Bacillus sp. 31A1R]
MAINIVLIIIAVLVICIYFSIKSRSNIGTALYRSTGVKHEFHQVDLEKQQVVGVVTYQNHTYMTVLVDVKMDTVQVEGSVDELGDLAMDKDSYIDMFKHQAKFFIDNDIANPKEYYEKLSTMR